MRARFLMLLTAALALAAIGAVMLSSPTLNAHGPEVQIAAGSVTRRNTPVSFKLTEPRSGAAYALAGAAGATLPLQVTNGTAWVLISELAAGTTASYRFVEITAPSGGVTAERQGEDVQVLSRGQPMIRYVGGAGVLPGGDIRPIFQRGGYIHPVRTPSGRVVTGDYPADHRHHHGIWFAWTKTAFQGREPDFWNMGDAKGRVEFEALDNTWNGAVHAGFEARHRYVDLTSGAPITVLREEWLTRVFDSPPRSTSYVFDVEVRQINVADAPLILPEYHYGGIALRGAIDFVPPDNVAFLTSEGKDRKTGDAAPSRWAYIAGTVNGARAGVAVLAHSKNFRAPEPMRIHPTDPYLCYAPSRSGDWAIPPKGTHTARYRFVAFDGTPEPAELERLWRDYVDPPVVTVR
jgi:hypothetical protein